MSQDKPAQPRKPIAGDGKVRVRFTQPHTHAGLPFGPGDEITIEPFWAEIISAMGSGHRIQDKE
jgi:hypothetical protein